MKTGKWIGLVVLVSAAMVSLYGCPKKMEVSSAPEPQQVQATDEAARAKAEEAAIAEEARKAAEAAAAAERARKADEERAAIEATAKNESGLQPIHFDYDRSTIRPDAASVLRANAEWLKANPQVKVRIEGNCDERGTIEYNQALGQRRAASAKKYLAGLGIAASRMTLVSYGKERPACSESGDDCWQRNRRDDIIVMVE